MLITTVNKYAIINDVKNILFKPEITDNLYFFQVFTQFDNETYKNNEYATIKMR